MVPDEFAEAEMAEALGITEEFAESLCRETDSVWQKVQARHVEAMIARDLEDLIALELTIISRCRLRIEAWHVWVSESMDRYDEDTHNRIKSIETSLLSACQKTAGMILEVKGWGYEIEGEDELASMFSDFQSKTAPISREFQKTELKSQLKSAIDEYESENLPQSPTWG
jgi:hypothetical protein